ncbi:hypothetical protein OJ998_28135 [Solirubrobacter taibaiensis]|nr:hypothetical protein [Solirubrobacter taibaiensis]
MARGTLTRRYPGVYSYGRGELSPEARWMAAVLACGEGAALAHLSSVLRFDCSRWPVGEPHVIVPRRHRAVEGIVIHHAIGLDPRDATEFRGIPTTTVARMLLDLSATHTKHQVAYVINQAAWRRRFDLDATLRSRQRALGHPGAGVLAQALDLYAAGSAGSKSGLEDQFLELVQGFPEPLVNMEHLGYEVDFRWPDRVLHEAGYTVVRFTGPELPGAPARLSPYF